MFINIPPISPEKSLSIGKRPSLWWQIKFSKILILACKTWNLLSLLVVFLEVTGSLHPFFFFFAKMLAKYPSMNTIVGCQFFFQNDVPWKKLLICNSNKYFSWRQLYFCKQQKCFMGTSHYITLNIKKTYRRLRFNKM